jgi:hypothetical protein
MNRIDVKFVNEISADLEQQVCDECNGDGRVCENCFNPVTACVCGPEVAPIECGNCEGAGLVPLELPERIE